AINPNYYRALYGLGVLYVFELNESEKAIPYLEQYMNAQVKDTDGMFVLARAYYDNLEFDKAVALYDRIIEINPNADKVAQAEANKKKVLDAQYSN
ncbi:MAG: tetratricopeptide repeat protein, partial [Treponema sp.]|nr:tetratricopeptide repeat protein [Treponema sp.]